MHLLLQRKALICFVSFYQPFIKNRSITLVVVKTLRICYCLIWILPIHFFTQHSCFLLSAELRFIIDKYILDSIPLSFRMNSSPAPMLAQDTTYYCYIFVISFVERNTLSLVIWGPWRQQFLQYRMVGFQRISACWIVVSFNTIFFSTSMTVTFSELLRCPKAPTCVNLDRGVHGCEVDQPSHSQTADEDGPRTQ